MIELEEYVDEVEVATVRLALTFEHKYFARDVSRNLTNGFLASYGQSSMVGVAVGKNQKDLEGWN